LNYKTNDDSDPSVIPTYSFTGGESDTNSYINMNKDEKKTKIF